MKKIDVTFKMRRAARKTTLPTAQAEALAKLHKHPMFAAMQNMDTLKKEVLSAMANYNGGTIDEAEEMFALTEYLRENPMCEVTDAQLALIEKAVGQASVEVKVTWKAMLNELN